MPLLEVEQLHVAYGSLVVVKGISFKVEQGEIVTLLGGNGAGKTTTLRAVAGLIRPISGSIRLGDEEIGRTASHLISRRGLALVPEGRQLFPEHTVQENLELGAYTRLKRGQRRAFNADLEMVFELFPRIRERRQQPAGLLSGGEQQMVAIGRALVGKPRLLVLDEPSLGLAPIMVQTIFGAFRKLRAQGLTILLVEQMASAGLDICDHAYVLESGVITMEGVRDVLISDPRIVEAYLGRAAAPGA
jgi:branched-chain amino acid transport system ATP-binding protein